MTNALPHDRGIDWGALRERLMRSTAAIDRETELTPERAQAVLDARARALARVPAATEDASETIEVVTFELARERYAIEARFVRAILKTTELTRIPGLPDFLIGVTNLRGDILAVVDLRRFLGITDRGLTDLARLIVLGADYAEFGILADSVHEVVTVRTDHILPPPATAGGEGGELLRGVTEDAMIVLDAAALLADEHLSIDQGENARL